MAFAHTWNSAFEAIPADSANIAQGAQRVRDLKVAISERAKIDHRWGVDADDGFHTQVRFYQPLGSKPTISGTQATIYTKTIDSVVELFYGDDQGNELQITENGALKELNVTGEVPYPRNYIRDLIMSNSGGDADHDFVVGIGACRDDANSQNIDITSPFTKRLDAVFAEGTNQGCLDGGTINANQSYNIFAMEKDDGTPDILGSTSLTPTLPSGFTKKRRIGSILTNSNSNIHPFIQFADHFFLQTPAQDLSTVPSTSGQLVTLTAPTGVNVIAQISVLWIGNVAGERFMRLTDPNAADVAAAAANSNLAATSGTEGGQSWYDGSMFGYVRTNTSRQIRARSSVANALTFSLNTFGWIDPRQ